MPWKRHQIFRRFLQLKQKTIGERCGGIFPGESPRNGVGALEGRRSFVLRLEINDMTCNLNEYLNNP